MHAHANAGYVCDALHHGKLKRLAGELSLGTLTTVGCWRRPIPIPTLDEFILLHKVVQAAVRAQPDMLSMIEGARRAFGWKVLGAPSSRMG